MTANDEPYPHSSTPVGDANPTCTRCGFPKSEHAPGFAAKRCEFTSEPPAPAPATS